MLVVAGELLFRAAHAGGTDDKAEPLIFLYLSHDLLQTLPVIFIFYLARNAAALLVRQQDEVAARQ